MKKLSFSVLFLVAVVPGLSAQSRFYDLKRSGFSGQVYAVKYQERFFQRESDKWNDDIFHTTEYYDREGNRILQLRYFRGAVMLRMTFTRPASNQVIERAETIKAAELPAVTQPAVSVQVLTHNFKYGPDGRIDEDEVTCEDPKVSEKIRYWYDANSRLAKETIEKATYIHTTTYSYGSGPLEIGETATQLSGVPDLNVSYTYECDSLGNWTKRRATLSVGQAQIETDRTITYYSAAGEGEPIAGESQSDPLQPLPPTNPPKVIRKSGGVLAASATRKVEPKYPSKAWAKHITGTVLVEIRIAEDGHVEDATALSGPDELRNAAVEAAKQWQFPPTKLSGVPVKVVGAVTFNFRM